MSSSPRTLSHKVLQAAQGLAEHILKLPPSKYDNLDLSTVACVCGRRRPVEEVRTFHTGVVTAMDALCSECAPHFVGTVRVVCVRCAKVVGRIKPGTVDKLTGMVYDAARIYHTDGCGVCQAGSLRPETNTPGVFRSKIIEAELLAKKLGKKV